MKNIIETTVANKALPSLSNTRANFRGIKRCPSCGIFNGQRALICKNENCDLRKNRIPFDPVQLVDHTGARLFSVRNKERDAQPRNFVQITEVTIPLEPEATTEIVSRNAVCFVDTCKYDASDVGIECKHIKACSVVATKTQPSIPQATTYTIVREVLWNLNISLEQKDRLWNDYKESEHKIPAVQKLNPNVFAVKCAQSKVFPAGRLHVMAVSSKKMTHACACKKLKIIVEPDNSVVMQEEVCDHILLLLAAILSQPNGKTMHESFIESLKSFWMPPALEAPLIIGGQEDDFAFFGPSINIGGDLCGDGNQTSADDIFIFGNDFLSNDEIPDLCDITTDLKAIEYSPFKKLPSISNAFPEAAANFLHLGESYPLPNSNINGLVGVESYQDINFNDVTSTTNTPDNIGPAQLELSDCNIELMDQFQLTNQIDLCSDDITLPMDTDSISILPTTFSADAAQNQPLLINTALPTVSPAVINSETGRATTAETVSLPPIELPTIAVEKNLPIKSAQLVCEVKTRKFPRLPAKRSLIVNNGEGEEGISKLATQMVDPSEEPSLAYSTWLENVIETLNDSVEITEHTDIWHTFQVHEEMFAHFSKSFSLGVKRRMPNSTTVVKSGKHKGHIKYIWYFTTASTARRIFTTKNISLQIERTFECLADGTFEPYVRKITIDSTANGKAKRIYPKLSLYTAHIWFNCSNGNHKTGLKVEWLPNAFPKSHFGIMKIGFSLGIKPP